MRRAIISMIVVGLLCGAGTGELWAGDAGSDPPVFILQWGSNGAGDGQFSGPHGIVVDADGNVYVVDTGNHRVQKFTSDGEFLLKWGTLGALPPVLQAVNGPSRQPRRGRAFPLILCGISPDWNGRRGQARGLTGGGEGDRTAGHVTVYG